MDFEHSERAQQLIPVVERFVRERIRPNERLYDETALFNTEYRSYRRSLQAWCQFWKFGRFPLQL